MTDTSTERVLRMAEALERDGNALVTPGLLRALAAERDALRSILRRVPAALNAAFCAGIEEREGGSVRRQAALLAPEDDLRRDIIAALEPRP